MIGAHRQWADDLTPGKREQITDLQAISVQNKLNTVLTKFSGTVIFWSQLSIEGLLSLASVTFKMN